MSSWIRSIMLACLKANFGTHKSYIFVWFNLVLQENFQITVLSPQSIANLKPGELEKQKRLLFYQKYNEKYKKDTITVSITKH